jgi:hypothetical protein
MEADTSTIRSSTTRLSDTMATQPVSLDSALSLTVEIKQQPIDTAKALINESANNAVAQVLPAAMQIDSVLTARVNPIQDSGIAAADSVVRTTNEPNRAVQDFTIKPDSLAMRTDSLTAVVIKDVGMNTNDKINDSTIVFTVTDSVKTDTLVNQFIQSSGLDSIANSTTDSIALFGDTTVQASRQLAIQTDTSEMRLISPKEPSPNRDTAIQASDTLLAKVEPDGSIAKKESDTVSAQGFVNPALPAGCTEWATAEQVQQLKKKLRLQENMRLMLLVAKDATAQMCFATSQVAELAAVFLSEEMRFRFLEMTVDRLTDPQQKKELLKCLTQSEFQKKLAERMQ